MQEDTGVKTAEGLGGVNVRCVHPWTALPLSKVHHSTGYLQNHCVVPSAALGFLELSVCLSCLTAGALMTRAHGLCLPAAISHAHRVRGGESQAVRMVAALPACRVPLHA